MQAVLDEIAAERRRQVRTEGWSAAHDDGHGDGSLAAAAATYAWLASLRPLDRREAIGRQGVAQRGIAAVINHIWPAAWGDRWFKPKNPRRDLVRAGALIVAEIQRLDRVASAKAA